RRPKRGDRHSPHAAGATGSRSGRGQMPQTALSMRSPPTGAYATAPARQDGLAECTTAPRFIGPVGASSYGVRLTGRSAPKPRPGHYAPGRGGITVALRAVP